MCIRNRLVVIIAVLYLVVSSSGCATYSTISNAKHGSAKMFSGMRLDTRAIAGETTKTKKFNVAPPRYPLFDLPFSVMADLVLFPMTFSASIYERVFE